jgi:hypothetical protein
LCYVACACWLLSARVARANGAFPGSQGIMTPDALPHEIVLATNFGLVLSEDDGKTWTWTCESTQSAYGSLYQMGPAPRNRIYTVALAGLAFTDDSSCTWNLAGGLAAGATVTDAFADPTNGDRVLSIVSQAGDAGVIYQVFESADAGSTLGTLRYAAPAGDHLSGIEIARSAPMTVYTTLTSGTTSLVPKLARSDDGGRTWMTHDLSAMLGAGVTSIRLISIDPQNPSTVFMRVASGMASLGTVEERIAVTTDSGASITTPLTLPGGNVQAFVRTPTGHLIVGGVLGLNPVAYRSTDGGASFQALPTPPFLSGLSARGTTVFGVTDNMKDGYAIATSADDGMTWQRLMSYADIAAIRACVMQSCQDDCLMRADLAQWPDTFCAATAPPPPADAGAGTPDASSTGTGGHAADAGAGGTAGSGGSSGGCHCATGSLATPGPGYAGVGALCIALVCWRRRRRSR